MIIKRIINGKEIEIELTKEEVYDAYCEQEHKWDIESCEDHYDCVYYGEDWYHDENIRRCIIEEASMRLRRYIDKYEMSFDYAIAEAFADTIPNHIKEDEE